MWQVSLHDFSVENEDIYIDIDDGGFGVDDNISNDEKSYTLSPSLKFYSNRQHSSSSCIYHRSESLKMVSTPV